MSGILNAFSGGSYGAKPKNTVAPAVTGTTTFGQTLTVSTGTWCAAPPITGYTYQWYRGCSPISGATANTRILAACCIGYTMKAQVSATNPIGTSSTFSNTTATVGAAVPGAPTIGTATATSGTTISVSFTAPTCTGGASITGYQVVCTSTGTNSATGSSSPISVTGLSGGTSYTFHVRAQNSAGYGGYSGTATASTNPVWLCYTTGTSYLCGVVVRYSCKIGVRWYPASRVTAGTVSFNPNSVSATPSIPGGVHKINIYVVGGGAGGGGGNAQAGGGGAAVSFTCVTVTPGTSFSLTAGKGGFGGILTTYSCAFHQYYGNYPTCVGPQNGCNSSFVLAGLCILASGGKRGCPNNANVACASQLGQGGTPYVFSNPTGRTPVLGYGGRGGNRNFAGLAGTCGGAGGGGSNSGTVCSGLNYCQGGNGSGRFGGGGGGGNGPTTSARLGGTGGSEAGNGGQGGSTCTPRFGLNGGYYTGQSSISAPGRAYIAADGGTLFGSCFAKGSSGGGGFPGGGGGSSYYGGSFPGGVGIASDGASGMVQIEWSLSCR